MKGIRLVGQSTRAVKSTRPSEAPGASVMVKLPSGVTASLESENGADSCEPLINAAAQRLVKAEVKQLCSAAWVAAGSEAAAPGSTAQHSTTCAPCHSLPALLSSAYGMHGSKPMCTHLVVSSAGVKMSWLLPVWLMYSLRSGE